jgi:hypothetical protein
VLRLLNVGDAGERCIELIRQEICKTRVEGRRCTLIAITCYVDFTAAKRLIEVVANALKVAKATLEDVLLLYDIGQWAKQRTDVDERIRSSLASRIGMDGDRIRFVPTAFPESRENGHLGQVEERGQWTEQVIAAICRERILGLILPALERSVSRFMPPKPRKPPSQTWRIFLDNHVGSLTSIDFFTVPTPTFRVLYVFFVLGHNRRRVLHFNVTEHPSAAWTAQQIVEAFPRGHGAQVYDPRPRRHFRRPVPPSRPGPRHRGDPHGTAVALAESVC